MFKNIGIIVILFVLVVACDDDKPKKPENLITKDKMERILYDLYVINSAKGVNRKLLESNGVVPEAYILSKHQIDSAQFANSNNYYALDIDTYKGMLENVKSHLEKDKNQFEELQKKENEKVKRKRDSVNVKKNKKKDSIKRLNLDSVTTTKKRNPFKTLSKN